MKEIFTSETFQMLSDRIDTFMEDHDVYDYDNVTIVVEKVADETPSGYHWKATLVPKDTESALKDILVEEHEIIRHFWCKDDIRGINGDMLMLTEEQVNAIARRMEQSVDCEYGINWQFINDIAWEIAPEAFPFDENDDDSDLPSLINERAKILGRGGDNVDWCMAELVENVKERIEDGEELVDAIDNAIRMMVLSPDEKEDEEDDNGLEYLRGIGKK